MSKLNYLPTGKSILLVVIDDQLLLTLMLSLSFASPTYIFTQKWQKTFIYNVNHYSSLNVDFSQVRNIFVSSFHRFSNVQVKEIKKHVDLPDGTLFMLKIDPVDNDKEFPGFKKAMEGASNTVYAPCGEKIGAIPFHHLKKKHHLYNPVYSKKANEFKATFYPDKEIAIKVGLWCTIYVSLLHTLIGIH